MRNAAVAFAFGMVTLAACGPAARRPDDGNGIGADAPTGTTGPEVCTDAYDNDGDGKVDCSDPDCSGVGNCPVCGSVDDPEATPIFLPDGVSSGAACTTDADCLAASPSTPNCIVFQDNGTKRECHASYDSTLDFIGFPTAATLTDPSKLLAVCVDIEHSYLHDLQIELLSPPDAGGVRHKIGLNNFVGRVGPKIFLGEPVDNDDTTPGVGMTYHYCWTMAATTDMNTAGAASTQMFPGWLGNYPQVPTGNYKPTDIFGGLTGAPLNGKWTMRVTDLYRVDNGHLNGWSIKFDPSVVADCGGPIIL